MCVQCMTTTEAVMANAGLGLVAARGLLGRVRPRRPDRRRQRRDWETDAKLLAGMGLDPVRVLGEAPPPAEALAAPEAPAGGRQLVTLA